MDALDAVLSSMRLSGSVFLEAEFSSPWCISSRIDPEDCAAFFAEPPHVISYHYVRSGTLLCSVGSGAPVEVCAGQILLLPHNDMHLMGTDLSLEPVNSHTLIQPPQEGELLRIIHGGNGEITEIFCGFLGTATPIDSFLMSLPSLLIVDASAGASGDWLASSIRFASAGMQQSPELLTRLAELLLAEAVRQYAVTLRPEDTGWLAGVRDVHVNRALTAIHARWAEEWTTESLAREVGLSRSALADRFTRFLGEPPMRYLARHRMNVAANLLREGRQNASNVAYAVGFNSEAAFNRAFKREFGLPPGAWKASVAAKPVAEPNRILA